MKKGSGQISPLAEEEGREVNSRWTGRPAGTAQMRRGLAAGASSRGRGGRRCDIEARGSVG
jgi:hypothetical protein